MYELNRHKRNDSIKWVIVFVSILVIITVMLAILSSGFTNWNVKTWFGQKDETEQTDGEKVVTDGNGNALNKEVNELPSSGMVFYSSVAEATAYNASNTVTVTATISPATADNKLVDWSVSWVNSSSSWASGKTATDYVTVSPSSDGSLTATISCKDAFGEQINVVVTSRQNPDAMASVVVDYQAKLTGVTWNIKDSSGSIVYRLNDKPTVSCSTTSNISMTSDITEETTIGTIQETYSFSNITVGWSDTFASFLESNSFTGHDAGSDWRNTANVSGTFEWGKKIFDVITIPRDPSDEFGMVGMYVVAELFNQAKKFNGDILKFSVTVTGNTTNETITKTFEVPVNKSALSISVNSVSISPDAIIF